MRFRSALRRVGRRVGRAVYRRGNKKYGRGLHYKMSRGYGEGRRSIFKSFARRNWRRSSKIFGLPPAMWLLVFGGLFMFVPKFKETITKIIKR